MGSSSIVEKKILILYFSYSHQTINLLQAMSQGMDDHPVKVLLQRIEPTTPLHFPIGTIPKTFWKMVCTLFRQRIPIKSLPEYRDGKQLFKDQVVIPLISCRGYWRLHWWGLKSLLSKCGASVPNLIVFSHPSKEPWRTIGVFLKLAGKVPERMSWIKKHYCKYGHTRAQIAEARNFGEQIAHALVKGEDLENLDFKTGPALYSKC